MISFNLSKRKEGIKNSLDIDSNKNQIQLKTKSKGIISKLRNLFHKT